MSSLQFNLNHIISFYYLAKEGSFSRAAERLAITQPAITQHIRGLEVQYGLKLVSLKKKRVSLTKAGEKFIRYAEDLLNQSIAIEDFLKSYQSNNISLGISSPLMFYFTSLIDQFKDIYPTIKVSISEGSSLPLVEELLDYKHDICLIGVLGSYSEKLRRFRISTQEQMIFVASPSFPLPPDQTLSWSQLKSHPLIIQSEGSAARKMLLGQFEKRGLSPMIGTEVSNIGLARELAKQNRGIAFMFEPNVREEIASGTLKRIRVEDGEIRMGAIEVLVNRGEHLPPSVEFFLKMIKQHFGDNFKEILS